MAVKVKKRDGSIVDFQSSKIKEAINKAFAEFDRKLENNNVMTHILLGISSFLNRTESDTINVENIQDIVEDTLLDFGYREEAKAYIKYRHDHELVRYVSSEAEILRMIQGDDEYWTTENSNKDVRLANTQRDYIAGITDTNLARTFIFPKEAVKAHDAGIIHIHDMDFSAERTYTNCCLVNLEDMLQNGTVINGIKIEKPHHLITATTIATQIIAAVSGAQYGGQTITLTHLAPFVRDSYNRYKKMTIDELFSIKDISSDEENNLKKDELHKVEKIAKSRLYKEIEDSVQTFNYQINSFCLSRGQTPFLTVFMYLNETQEYKEELALLIEEFLKQRIKGMKNRQGQYITVAFPF